MPINISQANWSNILNVHYSACLSVIFALTVLAVGPNEPGSVILSADVNSVAISVILLLYFFVDCLASNVRKGTYNRNIAYFVAALMWIWFLGLCIVMAKSPGNGKYLLLPTYFILARVYQLYAYEFGSYEVDESYRLTLTGLALVSLLFSFLMLPAAFALAAGIIESKVSAFPPDTPGIKWTIDSVLTIIAGIMLIIKLIETHVIASTPEWLANPQQAHQSH